MVGKLSVDSSGYEKKWGLLSDAMGWVQLIIINSIIALLLTTTTSSPFFINLVFSQIIGFSIVSALSLHVRLRHLSEPDLWAYVTGIPSGAMFGIAVSLLVTGAYQDYSAEEGLDKALRGLLFSITIGGSVAWYFLTRDRSLQERAQLAEQLAENAEKERRLSQAQLALLQAQIEPHFLFNTLSNVAGLIDSDSVSAKKMLESLTTYLRATLKISRQTLTTVQQEVDLVSAYLSIFKIRMGERLQYNVSVDHACSEKPLPALLLQPLVENAIKHGLEPQIEGGEVSVIIKIQEETFICLVRDTGRGLNFNAENVVHTGGEGVGLANVRERLLSLYGENARLSVVEIEQGGVSANIEIPLATMDLYRSPV